MAASNVNVVVITGNLTRDPELRHTGGGTRSASCGWPSTAAARTDRRGEWVDKPNYFDVTVWGAQGENCANYLSKGRPVAVEGRLDWREWEAKDGSGKRQAVQIVANSVQFLGSRDGVRRRRQRQRRRLHPEQRRPRRHLRLRGRPGGGGGGGGDDDIPSRPGADAPHGSSAPVCSIPALAMARARETTYGWAAAGTRAAPSACGRASTRGSTPRSSTTRTSTCCGASSPTRGRRAAGGSPGSRAAPAPALGGGEAGARDRPAALRRRALMGAGHPAPGRREPRRARRAGRRLPRLPAQLPDPPQAGPAGDRRGARGGPAPPRGAPRRPSRPGPSAKPQAAGCSPRPC